MGLRGGSQWRRGELRREEDVSGGFQTMKLFRYNWFPWIWQAVSQGGVIVPAVSLVWMSLLLLFGVQDSLKTHFTGENYLLIYFVFFLPISFVKQV